VRRWLSVCALWSLFAASTSAAQAEPTLSADIAPQPLAQGLAAFAEQTGLQLVYMSEIVGLRQTAGATAGSSLPNALTRLLDGTGLRFEFLNSRTVRIFAPPAVVPAVAASPVRHHDVKTSEHLDPIGLEQIVITATRREELLNRVPISAVVWTQDSMEA
jgi:iron complex outermembrane receptor protein